MYHHHYCWGKGCDVGIWDSEREEEMELLSYEPGKLSVTHGPSWDRKRVADPLRALLSSIWFASQRSRRVLKGRLDNRGHLCFRMEAFRGGSGRRAVSWKQTQTVKIEPFLFLPPSQQQGEMWVEEGYKQFPATRKSCLSVYVCDCVCIQNPEDNLERQPPRSSRISLEVVYVCGVQQLPG